MSTEDIKSFLLNLGITLKYVNLILEDKYCSVEDFIVTCKICDGIIPIESAEKIYPYLLHSE